MTWAATQAKAKFSEVLDKAETEGPQLVRRRKREYFLVTREELEASGFTHAVTARAVKPAKKAQNTAEFFRNSPLRGSGIVLDRIQLTPRHVDF